MDITVWIWMKLMPKLTLYFDHNVCKWQEFSCFYTAVEAIFSALGTCEKNLIEAITAHLMQN